MFNKRDLYTVGIRKQKKNFFSQRHTRMTVISLKCTDTATHYQSRARLIIWIYRVFWLMGKRKQKENESASAENCLFYLRFFHL